MTSSTLARLAGAIAVALCTPVFAIPLCELNGESVNPDHGGTTQGKSGLMRCRDSDTGLPVREQELQNGKFMGVVRYFKAGQLEREYRVNEKGNRDGESREWSVADGKRVLVREETQANGKTVGIARSWYPTGQRRRLAFHGDDEREQASVEFTATGKLGALRCAPRPVFGSDFDDRAACGHGASVSTVVLFGGKDLPTSRVSHERGERRKVETLWEDGSVRQLRETTASGGLERIFAADGTKRRELQWVTIAAAGDAAAGARTRQIETLDQEFHESGKLVRERKWVPGERGGDLVSDSRWYLNGQLKERSEFTRSNGKRVRRDSSFHDNGKPAAVGESLLTESKFVRNDVYGTPFGSHKSYDDQGRLRSERIYDDRGRITREREFDDRGTLVRDDEVLEDGSRKSAGR